MGRADLEDKNNLLLKTLEQHERVGKVIENIIPDMEKGFYIKLKTEIATQRIVEHLHRILQ